MEPLIQVENIHKIYNPGENEVRALDGVSLTIHRGELVAIIGHSGSGKSTLMNMLGCLDTPTSGRYLLNGQDVSGLSDNQLSEIRNKQIGFIFQGFNLVANLDALGNVELPLIYRGVSKQRRKKIAALAPKKSVWKNGCATNRTNCPADSSKESPSPGQLPHSRRSFSPMNRPGIWTPSPPKRSWIS